MRMIHRPLMAFVLLAPHGVQSISLNPFSWLSQAEKKEKTFSWSQMNPYLKTFQKRCLQESAPLITYGKKNPVQLLSVSCILGVGMLMQSVAELRAALQKNDAWAHWKRDVCLSQKKYDADITHELLHDIQMRYLKLHEVTDFMGPIRCFMADVKQELRQLQRYAWYAAQCRRVGLRCCVDQDLVAQTEESIERLEKLKALCLHWLVKTKLDPVLTY